MHRLLCLLWAGVLVAPAAHAQTSIYLAAPQCLNPVNPWTLQFPIAQPVAIEIRASGDAAQTFEFSIPGFTQAAGIFMANVMPNPAASSASGDPFAGGAKISFAACPTNPVVLYTATILVFSNVSVQWQVAAHSSPSVPGTTCATAVPCGGGPAACVFTGVPGSFGAAPHHPTPADGATDVELHPALSFLWSTGTCACSSVPCISWYFGEDPDPPFFFGICDYPLPELNLKPSTTYHWRTSVSFCGYVEGPVWNFTTEPPLGVEPTTWSNVKHMFR